MKNTFLALVAVALFSPFSVSADSYGGARCSEDPTQFSEYTYDPIRGTCKPVEMTSIVSLDNSLQNDYLLAEHSPVPLICEWGCVTSRYSEIIKPTITTLTFPNEDVARVYEDYDYSSGELKKGGLVHPDTAVLLDKKYALDYLASVYKQSGIKLDNNKFPQIILLNRNEMKKVEGTGYSYDDLLALFNGKNDPLYVDKGKGLFGIVSYPSIYTLDYLDFGKHIYSLRGSLVETHYLELDKTKLPPVDIKHDSFGKAGVNEFQVPITSPVKSVKNYWIFTKKDGKIVLVWQKSEYGLDNGKVNVVSNDNIKINDSSSDNSTNSAASPADNNVPAPLPAEQEKSFFSRLFGIISSWFR